MNATPEILQTITAEYQPQPQILSFWPFQNRRPLFNRRMVEPMLTDPRVNLGLEMIKGPILQNTRFNVQTEDENLKEFVVKQLQRFWMFSAPIALEAIEWGFTGSEVLYKVENDQLQFDSLKHLNSLDVRPIQKGGQFLGLTLRSKNSDAQTGKIFLGAPKAFWHVHNRNKNRWFGRSRFHGAFIPWYESWSDGGARDIRRLFFHKYAYDGGIMYHPDGSYREPGTNAVLTNASLAREIIEKKKSGGVMAFPNTTDEQGNRAWQYEPPQVFPTPEGVLQYSQELRDEILEGIGVPPEVAQADGTGAFAGRRIPQQAFYSTLQTIVIAMLGDFKKQIMGPLLLFNFGQDFTPYEIIPFGLIQEAEPLTEEGENEANEGRREQEAQQQPAIAE